MQRAPEIAEALRRPYAAMEAGDGAGGLAIPLRGAGATSRAGGVGVAYIVGARGSEGCAKR